MVENFYDHAEIVPVRGLRGARATWRFPSPRSARCPKLLAHLVPDWNWLKGATLKVGVAHGTANAKRVMEDIKRGGKFSECHFIEFMACPGGCLGGGGQPIPTNQKIREARARAIYAEDRAYEVRKSHENPAIVRIYQEFLTDGPCGHHSHESAAHPLHAAREVHPLTDHLPRTRPDRAFLTGCPVFASTASRRERPRRGLDRLRGTIRPEARRRSSR